MDDIALARALHVLAVVHWIGGVAFVTLVVLPLAALRPSAQEGFALFEAVERRFAGQVRISIPLAGAAGLWMTWRMDLWERFADPRFWWMSAMLALWLVFALMVFVAEPLARRRFARRAQDDPAAVLRSVARLHFVLLALAALTVLGAVAGAHGFNFF
ncbi:MAG: hypothetical protein ACLQE9_15630 [Roseiarcus sp.]